MAPAVSFNDGVPDLFTDAPAFKRFVVYIGLGFGGSIIFCMLFPNGQDLRPTEFPQNDFFIWLVKRSTPQTPTPTCIPSMHVIGCAALTLACFDAPRLRAKKLHLVMLTLGVLISVSTVFVKQHSMLDVLVAIPVSVAFVRHHLSSVPQKPAQTESHNPAPVLPHRRMGAFCYRNVVFSGKLMI